MHAGRGELGLTPAKTTVCKLIGPLAASLQVPGKAFRSSSFSSEDPCTRQAGKLALDGPKWEASGDVGWAAALLASSNRGRCRDWGRTWS